MNFRVKLPDNSPARSLHDRVGKVIFSNLRSFALGLLGARRRIVRTHFGMSARCSAYVMPAIHADVRVAGLSIVLAGLAAACR
jgi:hypothetical protein